MTTKLQGKLDYQRLFKYLSIPYIVFGIDDPYFTILEENSAHAAASMVDRKKIIGKPLFEAYPDMSEEYQKTGVSILAESIRKVIRTKDPDTLSSLNYDIKDVTGKFVRKYWSVSHHPVLDAQGRVIAVYQATEDITERVLTDQRLEYTEYQLKQALLNTSVGTWFWDIKAKKVFADANFAKTFGMSVAGAKAGLPTNKFIASIHPGDRKRIAKEVTTAISSHTAYESEYRTINDRGDVRWVIARGSVETDGVGEPISFPGVVVDITERKSAENNLNFLTKANVQFSASLDYKKTLNNIASMAVPTIADWCAIELIDEAGQLQQVVVVHKDPKKVVWAKRLRKAQGPPDLSSPSGVAEVIRSGKPVIYPEISDEMLVMGARNKKELKLVRDLNMSSVIIAPLKIDGRCIGAITLISTESRVHYKPVDLEVAVGLANRASLAFYNASLYQSAQREIKERKKLQKELQLANKDLELRVKIRTKQLEASNYSKDEFISIASHQLRTPATGVKQYVGMLLEGFLGELIPKHREILERAYESNERQIRIVSDLLKVAQVDAGKVKLVKSEENLNKLINDIILEQQANFDKRRQTIVCVPLKPDMYLSIDHNAIRMVLENIIDNASKYSEEGKSVIVRSVVIGGQVHVEVVDEGVGISPRDRSKLFEKFSRINNSLSTKVGGTGLGLYWAKKIVDLHGGSINYRPNKPSGSIFVVVLPKVAKL